MVRRKIAVYAVGLGLTVAGIGVGSVGPETMLAKGFDAAFTDVDTSWSSLPRNIWLSGLGNSGSPTVSTLTLGDTITLKGRDGRPEIIEITEITPVDGATIGAPGVDFQLITGRVAGADGLAVKRFLFTSERPARAPATARADRVL